MSVLTNAGKLACLKFFKESTVHFAFGAGVTNWGTQAIHNVAEAPANGEVVLPHQHVSSLVITNLTSDSVGTQGTPEDQLDFFVDYNGGIVHLNPAFAPEGDEIRIQYNHGFQEENPEATELLDEKIRKLCLTKSFVEINPNGSIVGLDGNRYSETETPTRHVYFMVWLEPNDYPNGTVREVGIFINPVVDDSLPEGQTSFTPAQIEEPGELILVANYPTIIRNQATRSQFSHILSLPLF